eukprot:TRINITY_DN1980_c0_g1_i10.p1 TRINITY_DN1980_c0_g1~~TRINITY_DN1980_c0_g1_i10.p1  ORF type:complete len:201 (+),score=32.16 TRINITY_DN1980_c0_g1_i10:78-680(+)
MSEQAAIKIVLLGNSGVGKTSIVERFVFDKFKPINPSTLSVMFMTKSVDVPDTGTTVKLNIWDTAGQERYKSMAPSYYQDAAVIITVYDVTCLQTFEAAKDWLREVNKKVSREVTVILVGNKADLLANEEVDTETVNDFVNENKIRHTLVSAKDGSGINSLFIKIAREAAKKNNALAADNRKKGLKIKQDKERRRPNNCC